MKRNETLEMSDWRLGNSDSPISNLQSATPESRLISYSIPSPGITAADFLHQAHGLERFYWEDGRNHLVFAGSGVTKELFAWGERRFRSIERQAKALFQDTTVVNEAAPLAAPRLFGGFAFREDFAPDEAWTTFQPAHFVLPHYQLVQQDNESWLTINAQLPASEEPSELVPQLHEALTIRYELLLAAKAAPNIRHEMPPATAVNYPMSFPAWETMISTATNRTRHTELNKVVLARVCEVQFDEQVNVDGALSFLAEKYANSYRFLFEPRPAHAFYGATPELLARVNGRSFTTMGLAGSIARGKTKAEDETLANEMLNSAKDRHEHEIVVDSIRRRLEPFTDSLAIPTTPSVMALSNIQHLFTPIQAQLSQPMGILPLVENLHPTPALGGSPRELAMQFISEAEPITRGWYGAPMGWIDHNLNGAFIVGIRSAVAQNKRVWLYAGAGIVDDSIPQKEWDETALKFRPMLEALRLEIGG
ncbi:MAG: isochorismate synthase [Chloroflexota bacterium]